jgi:hypothetical protein
MAGWLPDNTTPELFASNWRQLQEFLVTAGKEPASFPNAIATMWLYITEEEQESERMLNDVLAPTLNRPAAELRERLPIGIKKLAPSEFTYGPWQMNWNRSRSL